MIFLRYTVNLLGITAMSWLVLYMIFGAPIWTFLGGLALAVLYVSQNRQRIRRER